jgi:outer membrane protein assembly factor BamD (BamD/ComL family)
MNFSSIAEGKPTGKLVGMSAKNISILLWLLAFHLMAYAAAAPGERAIMVREANIYISPDTSAQKLGTVGRGREVAIIEKSHEYLNVFANVESGNAELSLPGRDITGWILDKGVVRTSTPNGDRILFGEASDSEGEASRSHGRRGAAQDAMRLYYRMAEYFPTSPLAGEAMWRSADIRWQIEREEVKSRPSAKEREAYLRGQIEDKFMKEIIKKFPGSKWADLAAYSLLDNKVCGDWQGLPKCPEKESEIYEKYTREHPNSPKAAEALYEAASRQAALVEIYKQNNDAGKAGSAKAKATALAQNIIGQYPQQGDWASRAQRLIYMLDQGIATYGTNID